MRQFDLIVISSEPFPYGQAATNRMLSYLQGIAEDKRVLYLCLAASSNIKTYDISKTGGHNGIEYKYIEAPYTERRFNSLSRGLRLLWRYYMLCMLVLFRYSCTSILLYSSQKLPIKIVRFLSSLKSVNLFRDITELVGYNYSKDSVDIEKMKLEMSKFSGIIGISQGIYDYFDNIPISRKFLLPVLVDMNRFAISSKKNKTFFVCSGANLERDGLLDSLKGFLLFNEMYPGYTFEIASSINHNDLYHKQCLDLINLHPHLFKLLGPLPSYLIPQKMVEASALLLTPHQNYQTKGFPTKLGEYLASGTPTICSMIDDLSGVINAKIVYSVKPNSPQMIADALCSILINPEEAESISSAAQKFMNDNYTIDSYKKALISFLKI